jgi:hypothetical protein
LIGLFEDEGIQKEAIADSVKEVEDSNDETQMKEAARSELPGDAKLKKKDESWNRSRQLSRDHEAQNRTTERLVSASSERRWLCELQDLIYSHILHCQVSSSNHNSRLRIFFSEWSMKWRKLLIHLDDEVHRFYRCRGDQFAAVELLEGHQEIAEDMKAQQEHDFVVFKMVEGI